MCELVLIGRRAALHFACKFIHRYVIMSGISYDELNESLEGVDSEVSQKKCILYSHFPSLFHPRSIISIGINSDRATSSFQW